MHNELSQKQKSQIKNYYEYYNIIENIVLKNNNEKNDNNENKDEKQNKKSQVL